jgi:hypothetical protein
VTALAITAYAGDSFRSYYLHRRELPPILLAPELASVSYAEFRVPIGIFDQMHLRVTCPFPRIKSSSLSSQLPKSPLRHSHLLWKEQMKIDA